MKTLIFEQYGILYQETGEWKLWFAIVDMGGEMDGRVDIRVVLGRDEEEAKRMANLWGGEILQVMKASEVMESLQFAIKQPRMARLVGQLISDKRNGGMYN